MQDGAAKKLEVHEHHFVTGPRVGGHYERSGWHTGKFSHSHEGGDRSHEHPDTGPASYTIDKDEWLARTGLKGGGRKKFTAKPTGEQFAGTTPYRGSFEIIVGPPPAGFEGEGAGVAPAVRMQLAFGMTVSAVKSA